MRQTIGRNGIKSEKEEREKNVTDEREREEVRETEKYKI